MLYAYSQPHYTLNSSQNRPLRYKRAADNLGVEPYDTPGATGR